VPFPRLSGSLVFREAEGVAADVLGPGSPVSSSSYAQKKGFVYDSQPRVIGNLIVDQISSNPAAVAAARFPVHTQGDPPSANLCTRIRRRRRRVSRPTARRRTRRCSSRP
jgi:hypothetical protein